jgi:hypothetical protein
MFIKALWDGYNGLLVDSEDRYNELMSTGGYVEIDHMRIDERLPTADEIKAELAVAKRGEYQTKDMTAKRRVKAKPEEVSEVAEEASE